jgi:hypothetical protein
MKAGCLLLHLRLPLVFWGPGDGGFCLRCFLLNRLEPENLVFPWCLRCSAVERIVGLIQDGATYRMNEGSVVSHRRRIARNDHTLP